MMVLSDRLREKLAALPDKPGCYLMRDRRGTIIYVGKAVSLRRRVQSYFRASTLHGGAPKVRSMVKCVADLETIIVRNEAEALIQESSLIKHYRPYFNILMRDDKRYPALRADPRDPVPRITACRIIREDGAAYFGPFPSDGVVKTVLDFTEKRFGLRKCNPIIPDADTYEHCINDIVRYCSAPCVHRVTPEEYRLRFEEACAFLRGERPVIIEEVKVAMQAAADKRDYEKAAMLRDTWIALKEMINTRVRNLTATPEMHAFDARKGIEELQKIISLPTLPRRIEGFDISNLFGTNSVASLVVAIDGLPDKRFYRRFRIKTVMGADDPRSMAEVLTRRYGRLRDEGQPMPDLIMVDGGITQLRAARAVLAGLHLPQPIPTVGLAKQFEQIVTGDDGSFVQLPLDSKALQVLIRLRDEAHRFAITYHRSLREKLIRESVLDELPGIGPAKKKLLLSRFGSVRRLARATISEIQKTAGIDETLAAAVLRAAQHSRVTPNETL